LEEKDFCPSLNWLEAAQLKFSGAPVPVNEVTVNELRKHGNHGNIIGHLDGGKQNVQFSSKGDWDSQLCL